MGALETIQNRWREVRFDETALVDPTQTVRATTATRHGREARSDRPLPRISVDLSATLPSHAEVGSTARTERAELEIQSLLGEGGMGRVYLARQRSLDRDVAIKTLRQDAAPGDREALVDEGAVTGFLEHPSIVPVHVLGEHEDGRPILVMKRVDGVPWRTLIRDAKHPAWEGFGGDESDRLPGHLEILMQVCNAAHFAHSRGVVHLDIKPQNVMLGRFGEVYLADWGLAFRFAREQRDIGVVCGTPAYMAPEMALASKVDARTDVYLLGATLHEVLTGDVRHTGPTIAAVMLDALASPPFVYSDSVPEDLAAIANRATARDPDARYASAAELRRAITDHFQHKSSIALSASVVPRLARLRELAEVGDEKLQHEADGIIAEVRFALSQALEQWSDNAAAARAMTELDALLAARRARAAALEKLARDQDPTVSAGQRRFVIVGMAAGAIGVTFVALARTAPPTQRELFVSSLIPLGALLVGVVAFRRQLRASAFNQQSALGLVAIASLISISRWLALRAMLPIHETILRESLMVLAMGLFASTIPVFRWTIWGVLLMVGCIVGCVLAPRHAEVWFSLATSAALLTAVVTVSLDARRARPTSRP